MASLFLTSDEIAELTGVRGGAKGKSRDARQADALRKMGVTHYVNERKRLMVARATIIEGRSPAPGQPSGDGLATPPADDEVTMPVSSRPALRDHSNGQGHPIFINAARFVTVELCSAITGLSKGAVGKRIERGYWIEGRQFRKAADGRIWIDMQAVEKWVQGMP